VSCKQETQQEELLYDVYSHTMSGRGHVGANSSRRAFPFSVYLSIRFKTFRTTEGILMKFGTGEFYQNLVEQFQF
jgi:hypothetical protein